MAKAGRSIVMFDLGGLLIDGDPRREPGSIAG